MKIKKVVLLFVFMISVFSIGIIKGQAWSCIYDYEKSIRDKNYKLLNFEKQGEVELKPYPNPNAGVHVTTPDGDISPFLPDSDSWDDSESCDSLRQQGNYLATKGACGQFKKRLDIPDEKSCPSFIYTLRAIHGGIMVAAGNTDPRNLAWLDTEVILSILKIKSRINDNGKESDLNQSQSNSSGGTSATSGCGVFGTTTTKYIKLANNILRIGGPLLVIALGIIDFLKILLSGEEKVYKEAILRFIKRLIALVALLLLPYILFFILKISGVLKMYGISNQDIFCVLGF